MVNYLRNNNIGALAVMVALLALIKSCNQQNCAHEYEPVYLNSNGMCIIDGDTIYPFTIQCEWPGSDSLHSNISLEWFGYRDKTGFHYGCFNYDSVAARLNKESGGTVANRQ